VAVDENLSYTIAAVGIPGAQMVPAIGGGGAGPLISEVGNLCTLTFSASYFAGTLQVAIGDQFKITLAGVAGYDGTFTAAANATWVPGQIFTLTFYNPLNGLVPDNSGNAVIQFSYALLSFTAVQTATTLIPQGFNTYALIAGIPAYNGTWRVANSNLNLGNGGKGSIIVAFQQFSVANAGGGTAAVAGNIVAGLHQITVLFKDREGYLTRYAPPGLWTAGGLKRVTISNIPIGPPNIVARILAFTLVAGNNFYYLSGVPQI